MKWAKLNGLMKLPFYKYYNSSLFKQNLIAHMSLKSIITLISIMCVVLTDTDISTNNCPSDFNMTIANVSTGIGNG